MSRRISCRPACRPTSARGHEAGSGYLVGGRRVYDLSKQLVYVRRMLRLFLAEQAAAGKEVPMQQASVGWPGPEFRGG